MLTASSSGRTTMFPAGSPSGVQFQLKGQITLQPDRKNLLRLPANRTRIKSHDLLGPGCTRWGRCVCRNTRSDTQYMELE